MKLTVGDRVAIIAPASQFRSADRALLGQAIDVLSGWGLVVEARCDSGHHFYLAGDDINRADHLMAAVKDPAIKAIFCTRGGYGSARLLRYLDPKARPVPKMLIGYSDITTLHLVFNCLWPQIDLLYGPNVATHQFLSEDDAGAANRASLYNELFNPVSGNQYSIDFLLPGKCEGLLMGGCLSMIASALGTPHSIRSEGALLFIEDAGELPYRIDRMITQLRNAGTFDGVKGVVFGVMRGCTDPYNDLRDILIDLLSEFSVPVGFGLPSGHGDLNASLRLRALSSLDSANGMFLTGELNPT